MSFSDRHVSLDAPVMQDEEGSLLDVLENHDTPTADTELMHTESLRKELKRTLQTLPAKQRETLCYFFGIGIERPMTMEDIAQKYELTVERVRQIRDKAIMKLKTPQNYNLLRGFLQP